MNQRGFATLEIIFVILIISILTTTAVPQMARMIDSVRLDYEMKHFLNTLEFAKSLNRGTNCDNGIFAAKLPTTYETNIFLKTNSYEFLKRGKRVGERYELPPGFSFQYDTKLASIKFKSGNDGTLTINSKFDDKRYIIFDSVGRWRGDNKPPQ